MLESRPRALEAQEVGEFRDFKSRRRNSRMAAFFRTKGQKSGVPGRLLRTRNLWLWSFVRPKPNCSFSSSTGIQFFLVFTGETFNDLCVNHSHKNPARRA